MLPARPPKCVKFDLRGRSYIVACGGLLVICVAVITWRLQRRSARERSAATPLSCHGICRRGLGVTDLRYPRPYSLAFLSSLVSVDLSSLRGFIPSKVWIFFRLP